MNKGFINLIRWGKKYWLLLVFIVAAVMILEATYSFIPVFIQYAFKVLEGNPTDEVNLPKPVLNFLGSLDTVTIQVLFVAVCIAITQTVRLCLRFLANFSQGKLTQEIGYDMRVTLYDHIQTLSYTYHNGVDKGDLIQRCTSDIDTSSGFIARQLPAIFGIVTTVAMGAYQVGSINLTLMFISLGIIPISLTASTIYFLYATKVFEKIEESEAKMTTIIQENVNSARVVRAFANEKFEFDKMDEQNLDFTRRNLKFNRVMAIFWGALDFAVFVQSGVTLVAAIILMQQGKVDAADMTGVVMLMGLLIWPMRGLGRIISEFGRSIVAANRIQKILEVPSEFREDGTEEPEINGEIEFKNVSFKFEDDDKHLLNNVSFHIKAGQTVAIVGKTGSGKSTIANILTRMLEYDEGEVLFDGVELKQIKKRYLRDKVKIVLQDPFLYTKTIYDNIAITDRSLPETKIYEAARNAAIHQDITQFEKGYKTLVGEKGATLSGGQKQRIAIARILVSDAPVVIFDDSLSAVDTQTDLMIRTALKNKEKQVTMFLITHRTTTAKEADVIIVLEDGKVSNIGTHEQLVKEPGLYQKLWGIQGSLEEQFLEHIRQGK